MLVCLTVLDLFLIMYNAKQILPTMLPALWHRWSLGWVVWNTNLAPLTVIKDRLSHLPTGKLCGKGRATQQSRDIGIPSIEQTLWGGADIQS